jgi:hypothetical protein
VTIRELHSLAYACGVPSHRLHQVLHDAAVAKFHVGSLTQLSPDQCEKLAEIIRSWKPLRQAQGGPPRQARGIYYNYSSRPRRGRPSEPGIIKAITPLQRERIYKIANQLRWTREFFADWLRHRVGVDSPDAVLTSKMASEVIKGLIYEAKRSKYPSTPARRGSSAPWGHREDGDQGSGIRGQARALANTKPAPAGSRQNGPAPLPRRESAQEFFGTTRRSHAPAQATP